MKSLGYVSLTKDVGITIKNLKLPLSLRESLQKPLGEFYKVNGSQKSPEIRVITRLTTCMSPVFVVGDFVSKTLIDNNFIPDLIIIDYKTHRDSKIDLKLPTNQMFKVKNPSGIINSKAWKQLRALLKNFKKTELKASNSLKTPHRTLTVVQVDGEEDLLVLPLILEASIGTFILYGQPPMVGNGSEGIVLIEVTLSIQKQISQLLAQFEQIGENLNGN
ncbi:MAG: GTP-dependent dephospho-CoA kinase family protein [Candidatus Hodarchaeales archaeon]|jgi:uncharacterized protein (UPF0218 family)